MILVPISLFGGVALERQLCSDCGETSIVSDGLTVCCHQPVGEADLRVERISQPRLAKRRPPRAARDEILDLQGNRCAYCGQDFDALVTVGKRHWRLAVNWDHCVPWAYSQNNLKENFVAACHVCNAWKSDKMFSSLEAAQEYLQQKWANLDQNQE